VAEHGRDGTVRVVSPVLEPAHGRCGNACAEGLCLADAAQSVPDANTITFIPSQVIKRNRRQFGVESSENSRDEIEKTADGREPDAEKPIKDPHQGYFGHLGVVVVKYGGEIHKSMIGTTSRAHTRERLRGSAERENKPPASDAEVDSQGVSKNE